MDSRTVAALGPDVGAFQQGASPPLFIGASSAALKGDLDAAIDWIGARKAHLEKLIVESGAIVLRGFPIATTEASTAWRAFSSTAFDHAGGAPRANPRRARVRGHQGAAE